MPQKQNFLIARNGVGERAYYSFPGVFQSNKDKAMCFAFQPVQHANALAEGGHSVVILRKDGCEETVVN